MVMKELISKEEIERIIPHAGLMCLNDSVLDWDEKSVLCKTQSHLKENNPLRKNNKLSSVHAIEYCAQAMAVHGGLLAREKGEQLAPGYLAAVRNVNLFYDYLDDINNDLFIATKQLMAQGGNLMYEFKMYFKEADIENIVTSGRATVIQMAEAD